VSGLDGMTIWIPDFIAGTQSLSATEVGAFMLILCAMWTAGGWLHNDQKKLARIARLTADKWHMVGPSIMALLVVDGDRVTCKRLQRELEKTRKRIEQKREAGRSRQSREGKIAPCKVEKNSPGQNNGFHANSLKDNEAASAHAEPPQQRTPQRSASETPGTQDSGIEREAKTQNQVKEIVPSPTGDGTSSMPLGNGKHKYPTDFEEFWKGYPTDKNMAKSEAFRAWKKLSIEERQQSIDSLPSFRAYCDANKSWYRPKHAVGYLKERRFEGHAQAAVPSSTTRSINITKQSQSWEAWRTHYSDAGKSSMVSVMDSCAEHGTPYPVATEWPPGYEQMAA
jgi:uncharacterized protein YdaU (DUF1376 family)